MSYKEKLTTLLKSNEEVRKDLEWDTIIKYYTQDVIGFDYGTLQEIKLKWKVLWEHHLRMYCLSKSLNIISNSYWEYQDTFRNPLFTLEHKPFSEQTDLVYEKIVKFLSEV